MSDGERKIPGFLVDTLVNAFENTRVPKKIVYEETTAGLMKMEQDEQAHTTRTYIELHQMLDNEHSRIAKEAIIQHLHRRLKEIEGWRKVVGSIDDIIAKNTGVVTNFKLYFDGGFEKGLRKEEKIIVDYLHSQGYEIPSKDSPRQV